MANVTTKLVPDGNSIAVRLPKTLLAMSGLNGSVQLEAKRGQIIIRQQKNHPRDGWAKQINKVLADEARLGDDDFADMETANSDGLKDLPWDGLSYKDWQKQQKQHAKK